MCAIADFFIHLSETPENTTACFTQPFVVHVLPNDLWRIDQITGS